MPEVAEFARLIDEVRQHIFAGSTRPSKKIPVNALRRLSCKPFSLPLITQALFLEITHPTIFYLVVATSTMNSATEQPCAEVPNIVQLVSERDYLETVCGDWSDYAETEDHQDNEHDQPPNPEEDSRRKKRKTTPSLMGWVQEVYAYFGNMYLRSSKLFSTEGVDDISPRQ